MIKKLENGDRVIIKQDGYKQTIKKGLSVDLSLQKGVVTGWSGPDMIVRLDEDYLSTPHAVYGEGFNKIGWCIKTINLEYIPSSLERDLSKFEKLNNKDWNNIIEIGTGRSGLYTRDCGKLMAKAIIDLKKELIKEK